MAEGTEFEARITFLPTEMGGRRGAICSGYRAPVSFGLRGPAGEQLFNDCTIALVDRECVAPGEECFARVTPVRPELVRDLLRLDLPFEVTEGPRRIVGRGVITRVFAPAGHTR